MFRSFWRKRAASEFSRAMNAGDWTAAAKGCEEQIRLAPVEHEWHNNLGVALLETGDYAGAEASFRRANELCEAAIHWNNLGRALLKSGRHTEAHAAFQRAVQLDPADPQPQYNLTVLLREMGQLEQSEKELCRFATVFPEHAGAQNDLGIIREAKGETDLALALYSRGVALAPGYLPLRLNIIRLLCELGRFPESTPHLQALAAGGLKVRVNATAGQVEIDIDGKAFYRSPAAK